MHQVVEALRARRSSRAIDPRPVEPDKIEALVEAFRWSPSTHNKQPWRLLLAESAQTRAAWDAALDPLNQVWAPRAPLKLTVLADPREQEGWHGLQGEVTLGLLKDGAHIDRRVDIGALPGVPPHRRLGVFREETAQGAEA